METWSKIQARYFWNNVLEMDEWKRYDQKINSKLTNASKFMNMKFIKIKSFAKINLALNVVDKSKKLHKIESLVAFIDLYDRF